GALGDGGATDVAPAQRRFGGPALLERHDRVDRKGEGVLVLAVLGAQLAGHVVLADLGLVGGLGHGGDQHLAVDGDAGLARGVAEGPLHGALENLGLEVDVGPGLEHLAGDVVALRRLGARRLAEGDLAAAPRLLLLVQLLAKCLVDVGSLARVLLLLLRANWLETEKGECEDGAGKSLEPNRHGRTPNGKRAGSPP